MDRVSVRELRQNLSVYLRQVATGEALEVTERRPVAVLAPLRADGGAIDHLVASGRLRRARLGFDTLPDPLGPVSHLGTQALEVEREERL